MPYTNEATCRCSGLKFLKIFLIKIQLQILYKWLFSRGINFRYIRE